jgi:hypothetical protein
MNLADIYDDYLVTMSIEKVRDPERLFVTDVGKCPRQVALRLTGAESTPVGPRQRMMWDQAEYIEKTLMQALDAKGLLYEYQAPIDIHDRDNWGGRLDIVRYVDGCLQIVEVKTVNPMAFPHQDRPKEPHVHQATTYDHYYDYTAEHTDPVLWYVDRGSDAYDPEEHPALTEWEPIAALMDELDAMRKALPELPPMLPRVIKEFDKGKTIKQGPAWQCKPTTKHGYCPYSGVSCFPDMSWNKWADNEGGYRFTDKADKEVIAKWALAEAKSALLAAL